MTGLSRRDFVNSGGKPKIRGGSARSNQTALDKVKEVTSSPVKNAFGARLCNVRRHDGATEDQ